MKFIQIFSIFLLTTYQVYAANNKNQQVLAQLHLPIGFKISIFADNLPNARSLAVAENGLVFVGTRQQGAVYAIQDANGDGLAEKRYIIAENLYMPNGVAYYQGDLYVAETNRIIRFKQITQHLSQPPKAEIIYDKLPSDKHHGWKYLRIGQDNKLYTVVGAPCNICLPKKAIYGSLARLNLDGSGFEILAHGIRNSVGFDWQPDTGDLWFTENGRDYLGDNIPPDELNRWSKKGQHFGFPYCHAGNIPDPELADGKSCQSFIPPEWKFKAHKAPLGMRFYTGKQFPQRFYNQLFVAQHGSWNRSQPHGYRIALVSFKDGRAVKEQAFISGWLTADEKVLGRPTDIAQLPDGSLLIADDTRGVVYRVTYSQEH